MSLPGTIADAGDPSPYVAWDPVREAIAAVGGKTMLLGAVDVGKTTLTRLLAGDLAAAHGSAGIVDADLGQSEIGPPCCVGAAVASGEVRALSELPATGLAFVGATSPPGQLLPYAVAVRRMADVVAGRPLVVDTSGYVSGGDAIRLYDSIFELLAPDHVIALQHGVELEAILRPMRRRKGCTVHTPAIPDAIVSKPASYRAQRRTMKFAHYFAGAKLHLYSLDDITLAGAWLGGGKPLPAHILAYVQQALGRDLHVYYGERVGDMLGLMLNRAPKRADPALGGVLQELGARGASLTPAPVLQHLLVGLEAVTGKLLGLGLIEELSFKRRTIGVLTPVRAPAGASVLRLGALRLRPDGTELGAIRPGDLM